ncbi:unnamed protein product [Orchesella dallaii]|uniref:Uncharacterized protein n=1 Tax=Orchesella dallaii TaxID=48710 RepID=A0ABP1PWM8_9HEXA
MHTFLVVLTAFTVTFLVLQHVSSLPFRDEMDSDKDYTLDDFQKNNNFPNEVGAAEFGPQRRSEQQLPSRKQRMPWTFAGFDVQETRCPVGQVRHPSGNYCTSLVLEEYDDYGK